MRLTDFQVHRYRVRSTTEAGAAVTLSGFQGFFISFILDEVSNQRWIKIKALRFTLQREFCFKNGPFDYGSFEAVPRLQRFQPFALTNEKFDGEILSTLGRVFDAVKRRLEFIRLFLIEIDVQ